MMQVGAVRGVHEEVVVEGRDIEKDGLVVQEELRKEG